MEINDDSVFIDKNSHTTIKTSNSMKFLAIEAKLISGAGTAISVRKKISYMNELFPREYMAG